MAELALAYEAPPCPALDAILAQDEETLPATDFQPMPDVRAQEGPLSYSRDAIRDHLRHMKDRVAVDSDMFVYYIGRDRRGNPVRSAVAPDVFVVFGVPDREDRRVYALWRQPEADIRFVLEIASRSTRRRDHNAKRKVYASLGVREYFLYDPPQRRRKPRLKGLRLDDRGRYRPIAPETMPGGWQGVRSEVTGLVAHIDDEDALRWFDPVAGVDLSTYVEHREKREEAERELAKTARALGAAETAQQHAEAAQQQAEARVAELEARLRDR